jgi:hypothetical protein
MLKKPYFVFIPLLLLGILAFLSAPAAADSTNQIVYQTPTAQPDGRVIYVVQQGDTCLRISLLSGTTIDELRTLNRLDQDCTLSIGKDLVLMVVTPEAAPTLAPDVTPTPLLPTPTPFPGNGKICVVLYNDINGNAVRELGEAMISGGAVSISDRLGEISITGNTSSNPDPLSLCEEVPEGDYYITMGIPTGYNSTTAVNLPDVHVQAGDQVILEFGAQISSVVEAVSIEAPASTGGGSNNLMLAIVGGLLVVLGIGLGVYVLITRRV